MKAWGITDIGLKRHENQDTYRFESFGEPDTVAAVVCDGMGGVSGGQIASSTAVDAFMDELHARAHVDMSEEQVREMESLCVERANSAVYARAKEDESLRGMGTTLVSAIVSPESAIICNVGDSRAYLIGADVISRVTRDHSVVESLVEAGNITKEEARLHPSRNLITRALGPDESIECDCYSIPFAPGDSLLLCSDGLVVTAEDDEIFAIVHNEADGAKALVRLVQLALERGAPDNVTVVLIRNEREEAHQDG